MRITKSPAIFIGSTNVPNSIVENAEFKSFVNVLNSPYPMPGRTLIGKELDKVLVTLKLNVEGFLAQVRKVSLYVLTSGPKRTHLGVTAHLFFQKRSQVTCGDSMCEKNAFSPHCRAYETASR